MVDPCAHNFERSAIEDWIQRHSCCPISRKDLSIEDLRPNHTLAERIEKWQWQQQVDKSGWVDVAAELSDDDDDLESPRTVTLTKHKYSEVPSKFMLLPQEREMQQLCRVRAEKTRREIRKRRCWTTVLVLLVMISLGLLAIVVVRYLHQKEDDGN